MNKKRTARRDNVIPFPVRAAPKPAPKSEPARKCRWYELCDTAGQGMGLQAGDRLLVQRTDFIKPGDLIVIRPRDGRTRINYGYYDVSADTRYMRLTRPGIDKPVLLIPPHLIDIIGRVRCVYRCTEAGEWERARGVRLRLRGAA